MKRFLLALVFLSSASLTFAQEICANGLDDDNDGLIDCLDPECSGVSVPIFSSFNTGNNGNGGVLPSGSLDANWKISNTGINGIYVPCVVLGAPATAPYVVSPWPDAQWVSGNVYANDDAGAYDPNAGNYIYHYGFDFSLPCTDSCFGSVPDNFCVTMDFFADNAVMEIFVNGVSQPAVPNMNPPFPGGFTGFHAGNSATITLCDNWQAGLNRLVVKVLSGGGLQGFLAQLNPDSANHLFNHSITSASDTLCQNSAPLTLTADPSGGIWGGSCGSCINSSTGVFTPSTVGNHYVTYSRPNMPNCGKDTVWLKVVAPPTVNAGANDSICQGQSVTLSGSGASTYTWDNSVSNGTAFSPTATHTYTLIGANTYGCKDTDQVTVLVYPPPVNITTPADTLCKGGNAISLQAAVAGGHWASSCATCLDTVAGTFTPLVAGNQYITYLHPNASHCGKDTVWMKVVAPPTVNAGNDVNLCSGESVTLAGSGAGTYSWNNGVGNGTAFSPTATNTYTLIGTDAYGCRDTDQVIVSVFPVYASSVQAGICPKDSYTFLGHSYSESGQYPNTFQSVHGCDSVITLVLTYISIPLAGFSMPGEVNLSNPNVVITDASSNAVSIQYFLDGIPISTDPNFTYTATQEGVYTFTQAVQNGPCVDTASALLSVTSIPEAFVPNTFTPNADETNNEWKPVLSYISSYSLKIFSRWGEVIFETDDLFRGWNGGWFNNLDKPVKQDIYVYRIQYQEYRGKKRELIGNINLIR